MTNVLAYWKWNSTSRRITMADFGNFCRKSIWGKSQLYVPTSKKSVRIKALLLCKSILMLQIWFFLQILTCCYLKLRLVSNTFWKKNQKEAIVIYCKVSWLGSSGIRNIRGRSQITLTSFCLFLITNSPPLTFSAL